MGNGGRGRAPNMGRAPNVDMSDISLKDVLPPQDKHKKLKVKERALFLTGVELISAIAVAVTG
jgi:hypothetical protein